MKNEERLTQLRDILELDTIPEISIEYEVRPHLKKSINSKKEMVDFIRGLFSEKDFNLRERFLVIALDELENPFCYFIHTLGTMDSVAVDNRLIFQKLLLLGATNFIVSHNHPMSDALPSEADTDTTKSLEHQAQFLNLNLIDHIILSSDGHYSYEEQGFL